MATFFHPFLLRPSAALQCSAMPKQPKIKLNFYKKATEAPEIRHSHVNYSVKNDGSMSTSRSTIHGSKTVDDKDHFNGTIDEGGSGLCDWDCSSTLEEPAVDQAYIEHIEETSLDEKDRATRTRPKGVC